MTKRWGPNTKSDLTRTKRSAAKRERARVREEYSPEAVARIKAMLDAPVAFSGTADEAMAWLERDDDK